MFFSSMNLYHVFHAMFEFIEFSLFSGKKVIKIHTGSYVKKCPALVDILNF